VIDSRKDIKAGYDSKFDKDRLHYGISNSCVDNRDFHGGLLLPFESFERGWQNMWKNSIARQDRMI
jgi:hypothetical protein